MSSELFKSRTELNEDEFAIEMSYFFGGILAEKVNFREVLDKLFISHRLLQIK